MTEPPTLVVLAAGLGSRFGSAKQFTALGPGGATLMDYGVFDAWRAGFRRAIFVIRPELAAVFSGTIGPRYAARLASAVVHQRLEDLPGGHVIPAGRERPWGTTHAVLAAAPWLSGPFAVMNADDFYGREAFASLGAFLADPTADPNTHAVLGYRLDATVSPVGGVNRALLKTDRAGILRSIEETRDLRADGPDWFVGEGSMGLRRVEAHALVSMNLWGFQATILPALRSALLNFLDAGPGPRGESYLPDAVAQALASGAATVRVLPTTGTWCGVTHAEDRPWVEARLRSLVDAGEYPEPMWGVVPSPDAQAALLAFGITLHSDFEPLQGGHINQGWVVLGAGPEGTRRYLLQRINPAVFPDGLAVQRNALLVSAFLQRRGSGESLAFLTTRDGAPLCQAPDRAWWRVALFMPGTRAPSEPATLEEVEEVGRAYGQFHRSLAAYDGPPLSMTLPGFHDATARFRALLSAADDDVAGRRREVTNELQALATRVDYAEVVPALLALGALPPRIAHNDAKASNVLLDVTTGMARCVVDLDTVMPGTLLHDTGDLLRSLAATAAEDAAEPATVRVEPARVEALVRGFFDACGEVLAVAEREQFIFSGLLLSWEQGVRFLTDYLRGDVYYRTSRPGQNLDRARVQLGVLAGLERQRPDLEALVRASTGGA